MSRKRGQGKLRVADRVVDLTPTAREAGSDGVVDHLVEGDTDLDRLRAAAFVAPALRGMPEKLRKRPVKVYDHETGETLRETVWAEAAAKLVEAHGIAHAVEEKTPETTYACGVCARVFVWDRAARVPFACDACRSVRCACGKALRRAAWRRSEIARRNGAPPMCRACAAAALGAARRKPRAVCACGKALHRRAMSPSEIARIPDGEEDEDHG